ncbi:uncharacterized protein LOC143517036 isoform X2 [Brachyhypopomus gauderio]|uniref:uncharacterized protein LOC143517036 isoform X2 n=1 Tax=Brachyhypopomus gauderio TaxID=698409 RepID=UPI004042B505
MSAGDSGGVVFTPLCQGFLKKRKDKMRMRWVTYWFKLHNTTLFFYTKKHGTTSDLRGQYYLFEVESVHEVMRTENKRYLFEITMKNGKRKVLAADTADLRQEWICQLLKAMKHPEANVPETSSDWTDGADSKWRTQSNPCSTISSCRSHTERSSTLIRRPFSTHAIPSVDSTPDSTPCHSRAFDSACFESSPQFECEMENKSENEHENDYDTLPTHNETADTIYDVPKSVFRNELEYENEASSSVPERPNSGDLLSDMMACLGENSAHWIRGASPEICKAQQ